MSENKSSRQQPPTPNFTCLAKHVMFAPNYNMFFPPVYTPTVEVIKTKEDKINDIKAKSKDIVTQKLIEVLNSFSLSSSARQPSLNMRFHRLCDPTGLHCIIAVFLKAR